MRVRTLAAVGLCVGVVAGAESVSTSQDEQDVVPFTIHVPDDVLQDLKTRLTRTRLPDQVQDAAWDYGTDLSYLKELLAYWRDRFDWRAEERRLNELHQFTTRIDGLKIHFVHERSKYPNALPLVL